MSKHLFKFAMPLFLSSLLQVVYNMVDMIVVGQAMGKVGLSAVAIGGDVSNFLTFLAMGFCNAGQVIISQYIGAGKKDKIGRFVSTMFTALTVCSVILGALCLVFRHPILRLMNTPAAAYDEALAYSSICIAGVMFIYGYNIVSAVLRGMGDSKHPFLFISLAAVLNAILDVVFVLGFDMGAGGAALATAILDGIVMRIGLSVLFGLVLDMRHIGFWLGDALAGFTPLWIGLVFYFSGKWKKKTV